VCSVDVCGHRTPLILLPSPNQFQLHPSLPHRFTGSQNAQYDPSMRSSQYVCPRASSYDSIPTSFLGHYSSACFVHDDFGYYICQATSESIFNIMGGPDSLVFVCTLLIILVDECGCCSSTKLTEVIEK